MVVVVLLLLLPLLLLRPMALDVWQDRAAANPAAFRSPASTAVDSLPGRVGGGGAWGAWHGVGVSPATA